MRFCYSYSFSSPLWVRLFCFCRSYLHESPQLTALGRWHGQVEATLIVTYDGQRKLTSNLRAFQTFRVEKPSHMTVHSGSCQTWKPSRQPP